LINKFINPDNNFNYSYKSKYNNIKIDKVIEKFILSSIHVNNAFNMEKIKKIKKNIVNKFNVNLSKQTIYNIFHKNNLTYKQIKVKNIPYSNDKFKELKIELRDKIKQVFDNLHSFNEMSIYLNDTFINGWSIKGNNCIIKTKNY
jgi:hypothetical protein